MNFFLDCEVNKLKEIKNINKFKILSKNNKIVFQLLKHIFSKKH